MEVTLFKYAFIILMAIAMLGVTAMATAMIVLGLRIVWLWFRVHVRTAKTGHA